MTARNNGRKTNAVAIEAKERAGTALRLRKEGRTYAEIAELAGYNTISAAFDAVRREMARVTKEPAAELIQLEAERLDTLFRAHYRAAVAGDVKATLTCLKIMERRARLLGLDAPLKQDLSMQAKGEVGGVLVVPGMLSEAEWVKEAAAQQAALRQKEEALLAAAPTAVSAQRRRIE
jgi:hypothetical protein